MWNCRVGLALVIILTAAMAWAQAPPTPSHDKNIKTDHKRVSEAGLNRAILGKGELDHRSLSLHGRLPGLFVPVCAFAALTCLEFLNEAQETVDYSVEHDSPLFRSCQ
jgi:hypothetical protein